MTVEPDGPVDYVVGHVEDALARDPRVSEQGLHVTVAAGRVFVTGTVSTQTRRDSIAEVVGELLPDHELRNETTVTADYPEPADRDMEHLP